MKTTLLVLAACISIACCPGAMAAKEEVKVPSLPGSNLIDPRKPVLDVYLRKPEGGGPFPAMIFLHACGGLEWQFADAAAAHYVAMGYAVAIVDSLSPRGVSNVCDPNGPFDKRVTPAQRAWDAYATLAYLSQRPDIDGKRVYVHGESHGGSAVIAAVEEDMTKENSLQFAGGIAYYPSCGNLSRPARKLLILAGEKDDWTPAELCRGVVERLQAEKSPVKLVVYPGAYHAFNHQTRDVIYRGHVLSYDAKATSDSLREIADFLR